jgi:tetratricopeptide (TPR) repeat protein
MVSPAAENAHQDARAAGTAGDSARAVELFKRAHELAPEWPYPPYDLAFTYLLDGQLEQAETWYALVDKLAPRGFFTAKTSLDIIRRERRGDLPAGFAKQFALIEWQPDDRRIVMYRQITQQFPNFAPAWKELAFLLDDDREELTVVDHGLAANPDDETYGMLILNKALLLGRLGRAPEGLQLIRDLLADPRCTQAVEAMAKLTEIK